MNIFLSRLIFSAYGYSWTARCPYDVEKEKKGYIAYMSSFILLLFLGWKVGFWIKMAACRISSIPAVGFGS